MPITVADLGRFKRDGHRFAMLTCYDAQTARIFDEVGVPLVLVGDTLGIMVLGHDTTLPVTMEDMIRHCQAVGRGLTNSLLVGDLPFGSYEVPVTERVRNANRLVKEIEGAKAPLVRALAAKGIAVMGHLGLTP